LSDSTKVSLSFGGETPLEPLRGGVVYSDSGRSSLRLLIRSGLSQKKWLVPNYLCSTITDVLDEEGVDYSFYRVTPTLEIDPFSVVSKEYDLLYVIHYFGRKHQDLDRFVMDSHVLIEDWVYFPEVEVPESFPYWAGFNSFRKLTSVVDGSMLRASFSINMKEMSMGQAPFVAEKIVAKESKHRYLTYNEGSEQDFLKLLQSAEMTLMEQRQIYSMSDRSQLELNTWCTSGYALEQRFQNFEVAQRVLGDYGIFDDVDFPCFYPIAVSNKSELLLILKEQDIFLPSIWAKPTGGSDFEYDRIVCIPMSERYSSELIKNVCLSIKAFFD
jgi:hypothetical protein